MLYMPMPDEVQLQSLFIRCYEDRKLVSIPYLRAKDKPMLAVALKSLESVQPGEFGIPTAEPGSALLDKNSIDLVIVPGVGFAPNGARLGMGGGFYDRFLTEQQPYAARIGLAFDCQLAEELPFEDYDQFMHIIITESQMIVCKKFALPYYGRN